MAPVTVGVDRFNVCPTQSGELLDAVAVGVVFTVTFTLEVLVHPLAVTETVYVPLIAVVALVRVGFCAVDV